MEDNQHLIAALAHWVAVGKLEGRVVLPAIQHLAVGGVQPQSLLALLESLGTQSDAALTTLAGHIRQTMRAEALRFYESRKRMVQGMRAQDYDTGILAGLSTDVAEEWKLGSLSVAPVEAAIQAIRELAFLAANQDLAPRLFQEVKRHCAERLAAAHAAIAAPFWQHALLWKQSKLAWANQIPGDEALAGRLAEAARAVGDLRPQEKGAAADEEALLSGLQARFETAVNRREQAQVIDLLCAWKTPAACGPLSRLSGNIWARDRVILNLTLRFGQPDLNVWQAWLGWMSGQMRLWEAEEQAPRGLIRNQALGLLLIFYSQLPDPDPATLDALVQKVAESRPPLQAREVIQSWLRWAPITEQRALLGMPVPPVIASMAPETTAAVSGSPPPLRAEPHEVPSHAAPVESVEPAGPPKSSIWQAHIQPFFVENWYIVAGIVMVILGSSLLAYYTWDKHWLVRYTIMPALLAVFTWSLAGAGSWIEKRSSDFKSTAAILRGAAIGLLPINFMAMALLSADEKVPRKGIALLVMALIYLSVFGWSLRKWCRAVEPALGNLLAGALLLLNSLVAVGPLARTVGHLEGLQLLQCLGAGFYLGFAVTAATIVFFTRKILTREMAEEKRVPWFAASALAITYLQVFVWVHGFMRHLPKADTYAVLIILTGWLVLFAEKRALELRASAQLHGGESFLGFALILLGLLMGFGEPVIRIVCFVAAGAIWMYQALARRHPLHYWIALTLLGLGGAAVGLLPGYPGVWLPLLGLASAVGYGLGASLNEKRSPELAQACLGMEMVALFLTTIVAPLTQWHYRSEPLATAGWLVLVAALFAWRALKDQKIHWLHTTMVVLALVLPYAGFVDMAGRTAHHNTMVFGLALLSFAWLGVCGLVQRFGARPSPGAATSAGVTGSESGNTLSDSAVAAPEDGRAPAELPKALFILQARSTVLWFYGALAVAAMLLRTVLGDTAPEPLWYRDYMDYTGPILMMLALVPATYCSRSLLPAAMAVAIMAVLFPELRANLQQTLPLLSWGSGLGSAASGLALAWLCFPLRRWPFLKDLPEGDRFLGRELFPLRRYDHTLFTWPILAAALFLVIKVDTWNFLRNLGLNGVPLKTAVALGLTGVTWTLLAIYHRAHRSAVGGVHLGWLWMLAAMICGYWHEATEPHWSWPFLIMGLLLQALYWLYRFGLEKPFPWVKALLSQPTRGVLLIGSGALSIACMASLLDGSELERIRWLYWFVAAQLVWHALAARKPTFGTLLFFQMWIGLLVITAPGTDSLWDRLSIEQSVTPTLLLLLGVQALFIGLEIERALPAGQAPEGWQRITLHQRLAPLLDPPFVIASASAVLLGLAGIADGIHELRLSSLQQALLLAALLLTGRAHVSAFNLLLGMLLGYVMVHRNSLAGLTSATDQIQLLVTPWRLALFALAMVLLTQSGRLAHWKKAWLAGPFAKPFFSAPSCGWIFWPAAILSGFCALYHTIDPVLRENSAQLWAPYLGALTFALVAWFWRQNGFFAGAGSLLVLGNIHLVRVFAGEFLRGHGLSELHLICLGLGMGLLQSSVLRRVVSAAQALFAINRTSLGLAGCILALLSANYFGAPNIETISSTRFIISGALAWLAGRYFRRTARQPGPGEEAHVDLCEALYHFGVVLAIWCAALLVPWFRQPLLTLAALGLPVAYFYLRAELGTRSGLAAARRYRNSAAVLGLVVLGLYVFRGVFHLVLFPGTPVTTDHYHYNAPLILLLGIVLLRLHGLGGTGWLAFYGGLALMTGSYFLLTALPGFSPFDFAMPAAWCAIGLGHFWILLSYARSPLRTIIQRLAKLDDGSWHSLRRSWGVCLLLATQGVTFLGIADYASNTFMVAPLLAAAATILIHQGIIRSCRRDEAEVSRFTFHVSRIAALYLIAAALELTVALHMDFLIRSYLPKDQVIWAILLVWLALLAVNQLASSRIRPETTGRIAAALAALVFAHVLYHRPWSDVGLWAAAIAACFAAWVPQRARQASNALEQFGGAALLLAPIWLVYFRTVDIERGQIKDPLAAWPVLATAAMLFLIGLFAKLFPMHWAAGYSRRPRSQFRLFDSTLNWLLSDGAALHLAVIWLTLLIAGGMQASHYQTAFTGREITLLTLLEAALAAAWYYEGKKRQTMLAYYLMQLSAAACFASIRRHLMLTAAGPWNYEYDVWASLAFSFGLAGAKQVFDLQPRSSRVPLLITLLLLPVMALVWVLVHGLGVNMALLVVGLHSVMFAYLGKDSRESPYNILALTGFVAFILTIFYSKLQLRAVHAFIIPVGLGVLVLQELFRQRTKADARNWIRLITLMAMLGSSGYYALADPGHPIAFNLTMVLLCLLAMGLGSFMQIRLYLAMGFAGLIVDLISMLYKVLVLMERSARMTIIGGLVLVIGAILVVGAIYYKTNQANLDLWINKWRGKLEQWE